jgi:hypothetical protein
VLPLSRFFSRIWLIVIIGGGGGGGVVVVRIYSTAEERRLPGGGVSVAGLPIHVLAAHCCWLCVLR